ncbi:amidohydrolase [archaeon]|nr:amidohydrolase [archaeon]|tara:strand:- start:1197 stop:2756 length:1560 start_codon:yes stop_codon:yes gene_type:complete
MYDILIINGDVIDGTGKPRYKADLGIIGKKIVKIRDLKNSKAKKIIDAKDKIVCPGFIDIHSHSDFSILTNPFANSKILQGVTTEVVGNCGDSAFPIRERNREEIQELVQNKYGFSPSWEDYEEYVKLVSKKGCAVNILPLLGYNTLRSAIVGHEDIILSNEQKTLMKTIIEDYMKKGGIGISTGLIYSPGTFVGTEEIIEMCKVVAKHNGIYTTHIRGEDERIIKSILEANEIAEKAEISTQISHLKILEEENWHLIGDLIKILDEKISANKNISCDQYPYTASFKNLKAILPNWAKEGGDKKIIERLSDKESLIKIEKEIKINPDKIKVSFLSNEKFQNLIGKKLSRIADELKVTEFEAFSIILKADIKTKAIFINQSEEVIEKLMKKDYVMIGSDGYARNTQGILSNGANHPRDFGSFTRVLSNYVRERKIISLEKAIKKMTSLPAIKLNLQDRGTIEVNKISDIIIFDALEVKDKATFDSPKQYSKGVEEVIVNGKHVVEMGKINNILAGEVIRI